MTFQTRISSFILLVCLCLASTATLAADTGWVLTTDYSSLGRIRSYDLEFPWTISDDLAVVPEDPVGRWHEDLLYVLGRSGSNILQIYDPQDGFSLVREFSLGGGLNVQDIAFDTEGEAYVSCYDQAVLLRIDVEAGEILGSYSTAAFADADGLPETSWMTVVQGLLYISCQKLDRRSQYMPSGPAALLVFDMAAEQWVDMDPDQADIQPINLVGMNPYGQIKVSQGGYFEGERIWVPCTGNWLVADGGVEVVNPATGTSEGFIAGESQLGGDLIGVQPTRGSAVFVLVSDSSFNTLVRRLDLNTGGVSTVATAGGYYYFDLAWDGDFQIYLADRTLGQSGLRVYDATSGAQLSAGVLPTGLPPCMIVLPEGLDLSSAGPPTALIGTLTLSSPWPNPCNPRAELVLSGQPGQMATTAVFDLRGRCVLRQSLLLGADGQATIQFTGQDQAGRALPSGGYRIIARTADGFAARSVTLVR